MNNMLPRICLATNNKGKVKELQEMLRGQFEIVTLAELGCTEDIEETADTFEGNSLIKAKHVFDHYYVNCISDDSGLEVEILNGAPGIYSARYAGEHGNHDKNIDKLLLELEGKTNRKAQFRTVVTIIENGIASHFEGTVKGEITTERSGTGGFGYDPIFKPDGYEITFSEMNSEEKNKISHRGQAIRRLLAHLQKNK